VQDPGGFDFISYDELRLLFEDFSKVLLNSKLLRNNKLLLDKSLLDALIKSLLDDKSLLDTLVTSLLDNKPLRDALIKLLLVDKDETSQYWGLVLMEATKREEIAKFLKMLSVRYNWNFSGEDIADIWKATVDSIRSNVEKNNFEQEGDLHAYVKEIAKRRAFDYLKKRPPLVGGIDVEQLAICRDDAAHELPIPNIREALRRGFRKLTELERIVMTHAIGLLLKTKDGKWPKPVDLTAAVNADRRLPHWLTLEAVKAAKARALKKLRSDDTGKGAIIND